MTKLNIILIPGLLSDEAVWQDQVKALSHYHILIPKFSQESITGELLETILAKAPPHFLLAGHSMGGWLALEVVKRYPSRVTKLCILSTSAALDTEEKKKRRIEYIQKVNQGQFSEVSEEILKSFVYQQRAKPAVRQMFERNQHSFTAQEQAMLSREDCLQFLPTIRIPTTVMAGEKDAHFFQSTKQIALLIKGARFEMIEECGHMLTMEKPKKTSALMCDWADQM